MMGGDSIEPSFSIQSLNDFRLKDIEAGDFADAGALIYDFPAHVVKISFENM